MNVTYFHRKNGPSVSIENLFKVVRKHLPKDVKYEVFISKYPSQGIFKRIFNVIEAMFHQNDINHVTGDVHFLTLLLSKKRTILTVHDCTLVLHTKGLKRFLLTFFWYYLPAKRVKYITVISEKTKKDLLSLVSFSEERIFLIPNCISDDFKYIEKKSFNVNKPKILQIGTTFNKNILTLFRALKNFPCSLEIIGKLTDEQINMLKKNEIEYTNSFNISSQQLIDKYKQADILSFISTYEGFGVPILEAQATGTPVLTSNISPMKEVAGSGACLVDPFDEESIINGIKMICGDKKYRDTLVKNGIENVKAYRSSSIANKYADLYRKVYTEYNESCLEEVD